MESLVAIGIDVHKEKFALVAILLVLGAQDQILGEIEVGSDYNVNFLKIGNFSF